MVGSFLLEQFSGIPTNVFYASEFRYSPPPLLPNTLTIGVSQSGETADTIAAIDMEIKRRTLLKDEKFKPNLIAITNRKESSIGRQVSNIIDICAGIEVGVAATKTFFAPVKFTAFAVAANVKSGTITSSPLSIPKLFRAKKIAAVPLVTETAYLTFNNLQIFFSNSTV